VSSRRLASDVAALAVDEPASRRRSGSEGMRRGAEPPARATGSSVRGCSRGFGIFTGPYCLAKAGCAASEPVEHPLVPSPIVAGRGLQRLRRPAAVSVMISTDVEARSRRKRLGAQGIARGGGPFLTSPWLTPADTSCAHPGLAAATGFAPKQ
jgi:hypothetical protein